MSKFRERSIASLLVGVVICALPHAALAAQTIRTYSTHIELKGDGSANVQEEVVYDFGADNLHGIYRVIPLSFRPIGRSDYISLDISSILVTDGHGKRIETQYDKGGNTVTLKIGDPTLTVTGPELFVIHYTLWGGVSSNLITDQFDWDVTGSNWQIPIEKMKAEIVFPDTVDSAKAVSKCMLRSDSGTEAPCASGSVIATTSPQGAMVRFEASNTPPRAQFVIQSVFPKGGIIFVPKTAATEMLGTGARTGLIVHWWRRPFLDFSLLFPFIVFFGLLSFRLNWAEYAERSSQSYILAGVALFALSFFLPAYNLATLCSGLIILCFGIYGRFRHVN